MERKLPKPKEVVRFVGRNKVKLAGAVVIGSIASGTVMTGTADKVIGLGGAFSTSYLALRFIRSGHDDEPKN